MYVRTCQSFLSDYIDLRRCLWYITFKAVILDSHSSNKRRRRKKNDYGVWFLARQFSSSGCSRSKLLEFNLIELKRTFSYQQCRENENKNFFFNQKFRYPTIRLDFYD